MIQQNPFGATAGLSLMHVDLQELINITNEIRGARYPDARVIFLAGSLARGEGTAASDLDLVVIYDHLTCADRESFLFGKWPVEAFVHDPQTLEWFFRHMDGPSGFPALPAMVAEAIEVPAANDFTGSLKNLARSVLADGPPKWSEREINSSRYTITDMVDDLRDPRPIEELHATAAMLYSALANHYFRSRNLWSARGKTIPRRLRAIDAEFAERFIGAFGCLFAEGQTKEVIDLASEILKNNGGFLFDGHRLEAHESWRIDKSENSNKKGSTSA